MRFRDVFLMIALILLAAGIGWFGTGFLQQSLFTSVEINREDAKRHKTSPLSADEWVEYQLTPGANSLRLYTNAALTTVDAPDYDLSNPRIGWKYAIEYELLDADRNLLRSSDYHFRSTIRQLIDGDSGETIYPLFFGKSGLVSTQTRTMQIAVRDETANAAILRTRLVSKSPEIKEVVARVATRIERKDFDKRQTWNRLSNQAQENISKYCVYSHQLLTSTERNSLMRFCWNKCPTIGAQDHRLLFVIGDIDDQDVREEQIPLGLYLDPRSLATIPVPEGQAQIRLEFQRLESTSEQDFVSIGWHAASSGKESFATHTIGSDVTHVELPVGGGLLELKPTTRLVVRAYWAPIDALARKTAESWSEQNQYLLVPNSDEFELTPRSRYVRSQLINEKPVEYLITHLDGEPTPLRLHFRFPYGEYFKAAMEKEDFDQANEPEKKTIKTFAEIPLINTTANWQFIDQQGNAVDSGELKITPNISRYDRLVINGEDELVSDPTKYFLSVPPNVVKVRLLTKGHNMLTNAYVRPAQMSRTVRVPEDYHAFSRLHSVDRSWFGLKPINEMERIRDSLTFAIATQVRPREPGVDLRFNDYQWVRYEPEDRWIARQMLIPKEIEAELNLKDEAATSTYFELQDRQAVSFERYETVFGRRPATPKIVYVGKQSPGLVSISINDEVVMQKRLLASCGEVDLSDFVLENHGQIEIRSENPVRLFVSGVKVSDARQFFRRSAQRIDRGQLSFHFEKKSAKEEMVTMRIFRDQGNTERCKVKVQIQSREPSQQTMVSANEPKTDFTVTNRVYDLRPMEQSQSLMLSKGAQVDSGYKCFVRLGEDLPPGDYTIRIDRMDEESDGYVLLYQTIVENETENSHEGFAINSRGETLEEIGQ